MAHKISPEFLLIILSDIANKTLDFQAEKSDIYTCRKAQNTTGEDANMKREERNEFIYIRRYEKQFDLTYGTTLTIRTNGSAEYKKALHDLYTSWGFHPASVRVDNRMYDDLERIIYIYGVTFDLNGEEHPWTELYTKEERDRFEAALH